MDAAAAGAGSAGRAAGTGHQREQQQHQHQHQQYTPGTGYGGYASPRTALPFRTVATSAPHHLMSPPATTVAGHITLQAPQQQQQQQQQRTQLQPHLYTQQLHIPAPTSTLSLSSSSSPTTPSAAFASSSAASSSSRDPREPPLQSPAYPHQMLHRPGSQQQQQQHRQQEQLQQPRQEQNRAALSVSLSQQHAPSGGRGGRGGAGAGAGAGTGPTSPIAQEASPVFRRPNNAHAHQYQPYDRQRSMTHPTSSLQPQQQQQQQQQSAVHPYDPMHARPPPAPQSASPSSSTFGHSVFAGFEQGLTLATTAGRDGGVSRDMAGGAATSGQIASATSSATGGKGNTYAGSVDASRRKIANSACENCRRKRTRCTVDSARGDGTCNNCIALGIDCHFSGVDKRKESVRDLRARVAYIENLFDRIRAAEVGSSLMRDLIAEIKADAAREGKTYTNTNASRSTRDRALSGSSTIAKMEPGRGAGEIDGDAVGDTSFSYVGRRRGEQLSGGASASGQPSPVFKKKRSRSRGSSSDEQSVKSEDVGEEPDVQACDYATGSRVPQPTTFDTDMYESGVARDEESHMGTQPTQPDARPSLTTKLSDTSSSIADDELTVTLSDLVDRLTIATDGSLRAVGATSNLVFSGSHFGTLSPPTSPSGQPDPAGGADNSSMHTTLGDELVVGTAPAGLLSQAVGLGPTTDGASMAQSMAPGIESAQHAHGRSDQNKPGAYDTALHRDMQGAGNPFFADQPDETFAYPNGRPASVEVRLPPNTSKEIVERLLNLYFIWHQCVFPVISRPSFLESMETGGPYFSPLLLNAILAFASQWCDLPSIRSDPSDPHTAGNAFFDLAKELLDADFEKPSITTVQALSLMASRESACGRDVRGWLYNGICSRLALDLGLHLDTLPLLDRGLLTEKDVYIRSSTFWIIWFLDQEYSALIGRPSSFKDVSITCCRPKALIYGRQLKKIRNEEDMDWFASCETGVVVPIGEPPSEQEAQRYYIERGPLYLAPMFVDMCGLFEGAVSKLYYRPSEPTAGAKPQPVKEQLAALHKIMQLVRKQMAGLPLIVERDAFASLEQRGARNLPFLIELHLIYHGTIILYNRPFLSKYCPKWRDNNHDASQCNAACRAGIDADNPRERCFIAAQEAVRLCGLFRDSTPFGLSVANNSIQHPLFLAGTILLVESDGPNNTLQASALERKQLASRLLHEKVFVWFEEMAVRRPAARRTLDTMREIARQRAQEEQRRTQESEELARNLSALASGQDRTAVVASLASAMPHDMAVGAMPGPERIAAIEHGQTAKEEQRPPLQEEDSGVLVSSRHVRPASVVGDGLVQRPASGRGSRPASSLQSSQPIGAPRSNNGSRQSDPRAIPASQYLLDLQRGKPDIGSNAYPANADDPSDPGSATRSASRLDHSYPVPSSSLPSQTWMDMATAHPPSSHRSSFPTSGPLPDSVYASFGLTAPYYHAEFPFDFGNTGFTAEPLEQQRTSGQAPYGADGTSNQYTAVQDQLSSSEDSHHTRSQSSQAAFQPSPQPYQQVMRPFANNHIAREAFASEGHQPDPGTVSGSQMSDQYAYWNNQMQRAQQESAQQAWQPQQQRQEQDIQAPQFAQQAYFDQNHGYQGNYSQTPGDPSPRFGAAQPAYPEQGYSSSPQQPHFAFQGYHQG